MGLYIYIYDIDILNIPIYGWFAKQWIFLVTKPPRHWGRRHFAAHPPPRVSASYPCSPPRNREVTLYHRWGCLIRKTMMISKTCIIQLTCYYIYIMLMLLYIYHKSMTMMWYLFSPHIGLLHTMSCDHGLRAAQHLFIQNVRSIYIRHWSYWSNSNICHKYKPGWWLIYG